MSQLRAVCLIILALVLGSLFAQGAAPEGNLGESSEAEHDIVIRISKRLLVELTQEPVEMAMPINTTAGGYPLVGSASGTGITGLEMGSTDDGAEILLSVRGTASGTLRSDVGPATIVLSSRANFLSTKRIEFDGLNFYDRDSAETSTNNRTRIDCVRAKHRGLIGKVIEKVSRRQGERSLGELNQMAEEMTAEMLNSAFDDEASELVEELNQAVPFDEIVEKYFPETKDWIYKTATRPNFLVAATGPANAKIPAELLDPEFAMDAQMELWLRLTPGQAMLLELIGDLDIAYDLLRTFLPEEQAVELAEDVKMQRDSDWTVIKFGIQKP